MAKKKKQHEARYKGMTAPVIQSLINDRLGAGEPLSDDLRAFVADCMKIALEVEKPPLKTKAARNLLIAEQVDILMGLVGESLFINGKVVKKAYYKKVDADNPTIAEQADIFNKLYSTKPNREAGADQSVFDVVGKMFFIGGAAVRTVYYDTIKTPAYLAQQADEGEPDYDA